MDGMDGMNVSVNMDCMDDKDNEHNTKMDYKDGWDNADRTASLRYDRIAYIQHSMLCCICGT